MSLGQVNTQFPTPCFKLHKIKYVHRSPDKRKITYKERKKTIQNSTI